MAYDVYFDKMLFPVSPSKIKTEISNKNKTVELINEGEVNMLKSPGLTKISFSALLPNVKYTFAKYPNGFKKASYYLDIIETYKKNKKPFQFIVSRALPNGSVLFYTNMKVSIEDYDIEDNASSGTDIQVTINLKQYREYGTKTANISAYIRPVPKTTRTDGAGANTAGSKYKIVSGDTLWGIAKKKLGSGTKWKLIYDANKTVIENAAKKYGKASSSNGHWIYPGTEIIIPGGSTTTKSSSSSSSSSSSNSAKKSTPIVYGVYSGSSVLFKTNSYDSALRYYNSHNGDSTGLAIRDTSTGKVYKKGKNAYIPTINTGGSSGGGHSIDSGSSGGGHDI